MPRDYDDDDDRPRRRRVRDEDEEDRPPSRRDRDDDDDRPRHRSRRHHDEDDFDDRPRRKRKRPQPKQLNVVGMVALIVGGLALVVSFMPWFASYSLIPAILGVIIGFIGLVIAQKSDGRMSAALPIAGLSVSALAVLIAVGWLILGKQIEKGFQQEMAETEAEMAQEEEKRKVELAKAGTEVRAAVPNAVIRVSAVQFYKAYEDDDERADAYYRNKIIEVTGTIDELDFRGEVYTVSLKAGRDEFETVDCYFAKDPAVRARLAQLTPGSTVTIRGKCMGGISDLEACVLVSPES